MSTFLQRRSAAACKAAATRKRLAAARGGAPTCARCPAPPAPGDCYCASCRALYMRGYRKAARKVSRETGYSTDIIRGLLSEAA